MPLNPSLKGNSQQEVGSGNSGAPRYELIKDFSGQINSTSPGWVLAVWRLALPLSFDRKAMKSVSAVAGDGVKLRGQNPLIIVGDCIQITTQSAKESHTPSMNARLRNSYSNYLVEILPDDWCAAWMVNNESDLTDLIKKLKNGEACNQFNSGLKFLGRVNAISNAGTIDPSTGIITSTYNLNASGFQALDNQIYYDLGLSESGIDQLPLIMTKTGKDLTAFFNTSDTGETDNVNKIISFLMEIFLGSGFPKKWGVEERDGPNNMTNLTSDDTNGKEAKFANLVPKAIGQLLGRSSRSDKGGYLAYPDTMECIFGVQQYSSSNSLKPGARMYPQIANDKDRTYKFTNDLLLGSFLPIGITVMNKPLWSVLTEYLNPVVNEMYVTLRANKEEAIVPTMMVRQIPFTTNAFNPDSSGQGKGVPAKKFTFTKFLDLPRWVVAPVLVKDWSIGRSNATRTNLVRVYGQPRLTQGVSQSYQITQNPPIFDTIDIQRNGFKPYQASTACELSDTTGSVPTVWMQLIADRMIGSQFTANGSITLVGIQAPICIGDNLEWNGVVYHIESLSHVCAIDHEGRKTFTTSMTLTNGLRNLDDSQETTFSRLGTNTGDGSGDGLMGGGVDSEVARNTDFPIYPGVSIGDNQKYQPGISEANRYQTNANVNYDTDDDEMEIKPPPTSPSSQKRGSGRGF